MHHISCLSAAGRCRKLFSFTCLLVFFLGGCALIPAKKVVSPPARTTVTKRPAEVPAPPVQGPTVQSPYATKPRAEARQVLIRPPGAERPVTSKPPEELPSVTKPPVEAAPGVTEPLIEEHSLITEPVLKEPPDMTTEPPQPEMEPEPEPEPEPERQAITEPIADYKPVTGRAAGIYREAEEAMQAGRFAAAEMQLERALRIEPRNAHYWYSLGLAKFRQKQYPQAVQFCLKAESLAGSQPGLLARNQVLLSQAKKAAGMQ